jgi:hypothetical protein
MSKPIHISTYFECNLSTCIEAEHYLNEVVDNNETNFMQNFLLVFRVLS